MSRAIVLPLYDHTPDDEIAEILATLQGVGLDGAVVVSGYILPADVERPIAELYRDTSPLAGRPGWRADADGREWYSAAWLDRRLA